MSYSYSGSGTKKELAVSIGEAYIPSSIKVFLLDAIKPYPDTRVISVSTFGHLYDGTSHSVTTDTTKIELVERRKSPDRT